MDRRKRLAELKAKVAAASAKITQEPDPPKPEGVNGKEPFTREFVVINGSDEQHWGDIDGPVDDLWHQGMGLLLAKLAEKPDSDKKED